MSAELWRRRKEGSGAGTAEDAPRRHAVRGKRAARTGRQPAQGAPAQSGFSCDVAYLNLAFAELVGRKPYARLVDGLPVRALAGEWVFAECLWGRDGTLPDSYVDDVLRGALADRRRRRRARTPGPGAGARLCRVVVRRDPVGRLRHRRFQLLRGPEPRVTCSRPARQGGASRASRSSLAAPTGRALPGLQLHRRFEFVDYACSGEADVSFPLLVRMLAGDGGVRADADPRTHLSSRRRLARQPRGRAARRPRHPATPRLQRLLRDPASLPRRALGRAVAHRRDVAGLLVGRDWSLQLLRYGQP